MRLYAKMLSIASDGALTNEYFIIFVNILKFLYSVNMTLSFYFTQTLSQVYRNVIIFLMKNVHTYF